MSRNTALYPSSIVAILLCCSGVARAQVVDAFNPGASQTVWTVAVQPDGKAVVGGVFTGLGGGTGTITRNHIGRLNVDGTVDPSFDPGANGDVYAIAVQPDGKILVGGNFTSLGGGTGLTAPRSRIGRLNADGTVDASFNPGANLSVYALVVQPDGKILVGGAFTGVGGGTGTTTRRMLARLNADGSVDSFNPGVSKITGAPIVYTMALQADGNIVVGGYFNGLGAGTGATARNFIGRIDATGTVDPLFDPGVNSISGVNALALQADGKIVVGGAFTGLGGGTGTTPRQNIGRLTADGAVDGFNPGAESQVLTLAVQADGRILAGGYFQLLNVSTRKYIGRLNADGSVDGTFNPGAGNVVQALALQSDGAVVAAGNFSTLGGGTGTGTPRNRIGRISNTNAAVQILTMTANRSVVSWERSGSGPEVSHVTFESSAAGTFYTVLGSGTRVAGGWQWTGPSVPNDRRYVRARGQYSSGHQNGSGSIVESVLGVGGVARNDCDGDAKADITIFRPSTGTWYTLRSSDLSLSAQPWGISTDVPVPGDYDGDGRTDIAIFRPSTGTWYVLRSGNSTFVSVPFGTTGDVPVPADYDGDGTTDFAVYRPSSGTWFIQRSTQGIFITGWGISTDVPVPGDYDGDGKVDIAVYRPSTGTWYILRSSNQSLYSLFWGGTSGDVPVPGDYDGDGKDDITVYRSGTWYILQSGSETASIVTWGVGTDVPVSADYDGDGRIDIGVYRPSTGTWYLFLSNSSQVLILTFGAGGDVPVARRP